MEPFLEPSEYIDSDSPAIVAMAAALAEGSASREGVIRRCFEFVRDEVLHSGDHGFNPVTRKASEALFHRTGFCYSKSHLLAALLRANGVPAGLGYQRLSIGDGGAPYCLHGLVVVFLADGASQRIDARGNKPGLVVEYVPAADCLAFRADGPGEQDLPGVYTEPLARVISVLARYDDVELVARNLPDQ